MNYKVIKKISENRVITNLGVGEKAIIASQYDRLIFLCSNFVLAGKLKRDLEGLGKRVEIVTSAREFDDENDINLLPFVQSLNKYISGKLDALIFLPCSAIIKFDKNKINSFKIVKGQSIKLDDVISKLVGYGYERVSLVEREGQFALRGDILDIFGITCQHPSRIELFDELVENISSFDQQTMKNISHQDEAVVFTASLPLGEDTAFDLDGVKVIDEPKKVEEEISLLIQSYKISSFYQERLYCDFNYLYEKSQHIFDNLTSIKSDYANQMLPQRSYLTDFLALKNDLLQYKKMGLSIVLYAGEERFKNSLIDFLNQNNLAFFDGDKEALLQPRNIYISKEAMPDGFSFLKEQIIAIGCDSLYKRASTTFSKSKHSTFYLPQVGQYVVHSFHGIGKCIKIERMKIADAEKDYFVIEYKKGDLLYLPSEEANTISAYIGGDAQPGLSALGGGEFARLVGRARASIKEMAFSLVKLYKARESVKGFAFKRDEFLEQQFAQSFGFNETQDQLLAINDINKDMESDKVMERLVCGDVGFGKTEVALRAIFKCIYNGKQAAFLCPTTILSQQHYMTAKARLEPFGVAVEVINRFKTPIQVKEILRRLKEGEIDLIIGTHRLLSDDVQFKDLGLLILDEEQRFGVEHKEKIKTNFNAIDVLSLSATPIPRTLNMSLSGIRDISIIETPPKDRLPIQTYLAPFSDELLKDVVLRELARGGQCFIVYNRVESIEELASHVRKLIPQAKVGVAHGQMNEKLLENVIDRLYKGEYNVLVATTLIENGINLPLANTMVVIEADRLGLSQLYQLRGRIGRSDRLSYAYITYDKDKLLTEEAQKRLEAIKEFSSLGSGFKIAMRDLELRGAGNLFGKQQHGHIEKVGYDMYVKLLDEEVKELKGERTHKRSDVKLEINISAFISQDYIEDSDQRVVYYSRISEISSRGEMEALLSSLEDGYGQVGQEIKNLCLLAYLRNLAGEFNVKKITINKDVCLVTLEKDEKIIDEKLARLLEQFKGRLIFDETIKIKFDISGTIYDKMLKIIELFEKALKDI